MSDAPACQVGGGWSQLLAATGQSRHAAVPSTVAGLVLVGALVTSAHGSSSSGLLPTQQLLSQVLAWEMFSAVHPAFAGPAPCFSHTVIKCSWRSDPPPTSGLEVSQVSVWSTLLAGAPVTWVSGHRGRPGLGRLAQGAQWACPAWSGHAV